MTLNEFPLFRVLSTGKALHKQIIGIKDPDNDNIRWTMGDHEPEYDESGQLNRNGVIIDNYLENTAVPSHRQNDFLGKNIKDFVEEHAIEQAFEDFGKLFQTGEIQTFEFSSQRSGQDVFLEARLALCGDNKVLAVVRDII